MKDRASIPGAFLFLLAILGGIAVYVAGYLLGRPDAGLFLGVVTWAVLNRLASRQALRMTIARIDELLAKGDPHGALALLDRALEVFQTRKELHDYLRKRSDVFSVEVEPKAKAAPDAEEPGASRGAGLPAAQAALPVLSAPSVLILCLMPVLFAPVMELAFPFVGLWPAAAVLALSLASLARTPTPWNSRIALAGLALAALAFALFGIPLSALKIPGPVPMPDFKQAAGGSWLVVAVEFLVLFLSVAMHESAHALAAYFSGDPTARSLGRVTMNPLKHIDLFGTILLPVIMALVPGGVPFGWAKPVPVDPSNFRSQWKGRLATSLSGVAANLFLALLCTSLLVAVGVLLHVNFPDVTVKGFMFPGVRVQVIGATFSPAWELAIEALKSGILVNMILFTLNILPVPPLDGYGVLEAVMPARIRERLEGARSWASWAFFALIVFNVIDVLLRPGIYVAFELMVRAGILAKLG